MNKKFGAVYLSVETDSRGSREGDNLLQFYCVHFCNTSEIKDAFCYNKMKTDYLIAVGSWNSKNFITFTLVID